VPAVGRLPGQDGGDRQKGEVMTINEFWEKYNHCPLCQAYPVQGDACDNCRYALPIFGSRPGKDDKFVPTKEAAKAMNEEVTEW